MARLLAISLEVILLISDAPPLSSLAAFAAL
jgi:hypothetical protein